MAILVIFLKIIGSSGLGAGAGTSGAAAAGITQKIVTQSIDNSAGITARTALVTTKASTGSARVAGNYLQWPTI